MKAKKNFFIGSSVVLLLIFGVLLWNCTSKKDSENQIVNIGVIYPLTGDASFWGQNAKNGVQLAVEKFLPQNFLKGKQIQAIYEDSKSASKDAVSAANKLISQDTNTTTLSR